MGKNFEPIGDSDPNNFLSAFDGQGHAISNLEMTSPHSTLACSGFQKGRPSGTSSSTRPAQSQVLTVVLNGLIWEGSLGIAPRKTVLAPSRTV